MAKDPIDMLKKHLEGMNAILEKHLSNIDILLQEVRDALQGVEKSTTYLPVGVGWQEYQFTINVATPNPPTIPPNFPNQNQNPEQISDNISTPGYILIEVYKKKTPLQNAKNMWIVVDSSGSQGRPILVRQSRMNQQYSDEFAMVTGEVRKLTDVRDIRIRSTDGGQQVRISEREIMPPYVTNTVNPFAITNPPSFTAQNIIIPFPGTINLPSISIPGTFQLLIIASSNNPGNVFISRTDATNVALRNTLLPSTSRTLAIANANVVNLAASSAGNSVDIIVEQPA